jgi:fructuronate reductase
VHLGLGAFHKAHQAWYTDVVDDEGEWGIAAFTGRSPAAATALTEQGCAYTVIERGPGGDGARLVGSIVEAHDGADVRQLRQLLASPRTAIVTITVTEAGYRLTADGRPDYADDAVQADMAALATDERVLTTPLCRLVEGLAARRLAGAGPIAVVPCDNMPRNGSVVAEAVLELAAHWGPEVQAWIAENVSFVSTSVDRITPRTTAGDVAQVAALTGFVDRAPVVTEPFHDWIISGDFPAGRPPWERAGARFVEDIEPWERRKLWLLNGSHSLLASAGRLRGHATVHEAVSDPACRARVEDFWDEAARHLPDELDVPAYRRSLLDRYDNPRIEHRLDQIGQDGSLKLRMRVVPVVLAERAAGRSGGAGIRTVASWIALMLEQGSAPDPQRDAIEAAVAQDPDDAVRSLTLLIDPALLRHPDIHPEICRHVHEEIESSRDMNRERN